MDEQEKKDGMQQQEDSKAGADKNSNKGADQTGGNSGQQGANGDTAGSGEDKGGKVFTQEQVNAIAAKESSQAMRKVFKELGMSEAEIKKLIAEHKAAQPPEEQNAEVLAKLQEAEAKAARAQAESMALRMDAKPEYVEDVVDMVEARLLRGESEDVKTIVAELKSKHAHMFGEQKHKDDDKKEDKKEEKKKGQRGTGGSVAAGRTKEDEGEQSLGQRLAASRRKNQGTVNGAAPKKYWGNK